MTTPARYLIEVAVETPADAAAAAGSGADRVELSTALDLGGLTPSIGLYEQVRRVTQLPVLVMIRPRPGDFVYDESDLMVMARDIEVFRPLAPAGFVFGVIDEDGTVDKLQCGWLRGLCGPIPCVFHRAFDRCPEPREALEEVIHLGFTRVLTSGRESAALSGAGLIAELQKQAGPRAQMLPCGRIRASNVAEVVKITGCRQIHASFGEPVPESRGLGRRGYAPRSRVNVTDLTETRERLDALADD